MEPPTVKGAIKLLNDYTLACKAVLETTSHNNERNSATNHLARCAEMYAILLDTNDLSGINEIVQQERRNHGWSYFSNDEGEHLANTWVALTDYLNTNG